MKTFLVPLFSLSLFSAALAQVDLFGSNTENTGLSGALYDLKHEEDGDVNRNIFGEGRVNVGEVYNLIKKLSMRGFRQDKLDDYMVGDAHCFLKMVAIPSSDAKLAPQAFGSGEIDPTALLIVYNGTVKKAPAERVRFSGRFDDMMMVLVNGEVVFHFAYDIDDINYRGLELSKRAEEHIRDKGLGGTGGDVYGEYIELKEGDKLMVVMAEIPGGFMGGTLKVQLEDSEYTLDTYEDPILPPFVAGKLTDEEIKRLEASRLNFDLKDVPEFEFGYPEKDGDS